MFFIKNIHFQELCLRIIHHIYSREATKLTIIYSSGSGLVKVTYVISHTPFYDTRMYLLKPVGLVTAFAHSSHHMNVPCYKFETILKR